MNSAKEIANILVSSKSNPKEFKRYLLTPKHYAYIKISDGCNHKCSFCAIPNIKGKHKSKKMEEIIEEVQMLYDKGVKEFNIIGQDTTYYGYDLYGQRCISLLLNNLASIAKESWIRLLYTFPTNFPNDLIKTISKYENICKYIDLPLQHCSDKVLKSMNRGITKKQIENLLIRIRKKIDNVAIRSTFIVGYPEESEKDFEDLLSFIKEQKLDRVGVFTYSHEENTPAFKLEDKIPDYVKQERKDIILETQKQISYKKNSDKIGSILKVLVDEKKSNKLYCRTEYDAPDIDNSVITAYKKGIKIGDFVNIKITGASEYDLYGESL